jgi:hypothetical protein
MADDTPTPEEIAAKEAMAKANERLAASLREVNAAYTTKNIDNVKKSQQEYAASVAAAQKASGKQNVETKEQIEVFKRSQRQLDVINSAMKIGKKSTDLFGDASARLAKTLLQMGASAAPLAIALGRGGLSGAFDELGKPLRDIEIAAVRTFGALDTESAKLFVEGQKRLRIMIDDQATGQMAVDSRLKTLALDPVKAQKQIVDEQQKLQTQVGQNLDRFKGEITDPEVILNLRGLREALGLTADESAVFANRAAAFGTSIQGQFVVAASAAQKFAKSSGVDFKIIAKGQNDLRKNTRAFATFSEEQLARVAAASAKTGVALATMGGGLVDSFDDFDSAAEKAAMLGQSFGISIDAFELFATEDPTERLQMIQEAASRAGVDIANMGRRELNYLSELTGMGVEDTMKALGQGGLEVAAEVAGIDKAGDLQAQLVAAQQASNQSTQALTAQMAKLIPVFQESGEDIRAGLTERGLRAMTGQSGELREAQGQFTRDAITGGTTAMLAGRPGGLMGLQQGFMTDPAVTDMMSSANTGFMRQAPGLLDKGLEFSKDTFSALKDPQFREGVVSDAIKAVQSTREKAQKAAQMLKALKAAGGTKEQLEKLRESFGGKIPSIPGLGSLEGDVEADTNAALKAGQAGTATQGPINLVVNVSLPVDGDAIASAAYTGQIRPGVTGEQALQAAAANENPANE